MKKYISIILITIITMVSVIQCGKKSDLYGDAIPKDLKITPIKSILTQPNEFENKVVRVQGKIERECPSGCWFYVQEGNDKIYIDINPSGFAIPQKQGKPVDIFGTVKKVGKRHIVIGKGVEIL